MGYFLTKFRKDTLALHNIVETKTYIDRYLDEARDSTNEQQAKRYEGENSLTLLDHYRHLCQLLPIYEVLEKKIADEHFNPPLPNEPLNLIQALKQADKIRNDLQFLRQHIYASRQDVLLETTEEYLDRLEALEVKKEENANEILAHYLVRILGDLFGGQKIRACISSMYDRSQITRANPDEGLNFCTFEKSTLITLINWLNSLLKDDRPNNVIIIDEKLLSLNDYEQIAIAANNAFKTHIELYEELEQTRADAARLEYHAMSAAQPTVAVANNSNSFFNNPTVTAVAATASAAVVVTGLIASIYFNRSP